MKKNFRDVLFLVVGGMFIPYIVNCLMIMGDVEDWLKKIFVEISGWCFLLGFILFRLSYYRLFDVIKWWKVSLYFIWVYWGVFGVVAGVLILLR